MRCLIFRSLPVSADARTVRTAALFKDFGVTIYSWEREKKGNRLKDGYDVFPFPLLKKTSFFRYGLYCIWVAIIIIANVKRGDIVIMMDLETALLGVFACRIKRAYSIFDVVDPFAETKIKMPELRKAVIYLEAFICENARLVVFPHESRIKYYEDELGQALKLHNKIIIENVPQINKKTIITTRGDEILKRKKGRIVIGYMGTLDESSRGLEFLLSFAKHYPEELYVLFAGQGALETRINSESQDNDNLYFWGRFSQDHLAVIYEVIDMVWAFYSPSVWLHKYAAPNKYYEHLYFKKPIITSAIIPQSENIIANNSGIVIQDVVSSNSFYETLYNSICEMRTQIELPFFRKENLWDKCYKNYYINKKKELINLIIDGN